MESSVSSSRIHPENPYRCGCRWAASAPSLAQRKGWGSRTLLERVSAARSAAVGDLLLLSRLRAMLAVRSGALRCSGRPREQGWERSALGAGRCGQRRSALLRLRSCSAASSGLPAIRHQVPWLLRSQEERAGAKLLKSSGSESSGSLGGQDRDSFGERPDLWLGADCPWNSLMLLPGRLSANNWDRQ